jgi:protein TonB
MARFERFPWLRRDGAPLAISLVLHVLALLLIAPWLVMRTIPGPQVEVEVMLEEDVPEPPSSRPEKATRLRDLVKVQRPRTQSVRPQRVQIQPLVSQPQQSTVSLVQLPPNPVPATQPGQGESGRAAPAPREVAGLSAPGQAASRASQPSAAEAIPAGETPLQPSSALATPASPSPSLGSTPQPSSRAAAAPSRPGEDRDDGPVNLAGPVPQAQSAQPEFRQASRLGGQSSLRGGSQAPDSGLAPQPGSPEQTAMVAARAVPQALPGSGISLGGQPPALAAPTSRISGQGGVVAKESASRADQLAPTGAGQGAAPSIRPVSGVSRSGQAPAPATAAPRGSGQGSVVASERGSAAGPGLAAAPVAGQSAPLAIRAQPGSGQGGAGLGSGSRTVSPSERGSGQLAAAPLGTPGPGTASVGSGPGAGLSGEGRAQQLAGSGSAARETAAPLLAAAGGGGAARGAAESGSAQLSGRAEPPAPAQPVREGRATPMQNVQPTGQARVIDERFTAPALKVESPRSICELPLLFAGFDRKPIPKGLDTINASEPMQGEVPPRHLPSNEAPRYPLAALAARAQGRTLVRAEIRPDGTVGQLWVKQGSGFQALDLAALETVRVWRFVPAQKHGMAVAMWMDVPIEYKLP